MLRRTNASELARPCRRLGDDVRQRGRQRHPTPEERDNPLVSQPSSGGHEPRGILAGGVAGPGRRREPGGAIRCGAARCDCGYGRAGAGRPGAAGCPGLIGVRRRRPECRRKPSRVRRSCRCCPGDLRHSRPPRRSCRDSRGLTSLPRNFRSWRRTGSGCRLVHCAHHLSLKRLCETDAAPILACAPHAGARVGGLAKTPWLAAGAVVRFAT